MKKAIALMLALLLVGGLFACGNEAPAGTTAPTTEATTAPTTEATEPDDGVMSYAEYVAAELETEVVIQAYVQAAQKYNAEYGNTTLYLQDKDGAYFVYRLACTAEEYTLFAPGTLVKFTGTKTAWSGEVEVVDAKFEVVEGGDTYIAEAIDLTEKMDAEDLIDYQNQLAVFKGLTVKSISYKNDGGDDIYLTLTKGDKDYKFCVEVDLTGTDTEVYTTVGTLAEGDVVDVEGFLYWYEEMNPHVTAITKN